MVQPLDLRTSSTMESKRKLIGRLVTEPLGANGSYRKEGMKFKISQKRLVIPRYDTRASRCVKSADA